MKQLLLLHGFEGRPTGNWLPWLEAEMTTEGWTVINPTLPHPDSPDKEETLDFLRTLTKGFGKNDCIVGHSLGAFFALELSRDLELKHLVLVAPALQKIDLTEMQKRWPKSDVPALARVIGEGISAEPCLAKTKTILLSTNDPYIDLNLKDQFNDDWEKIILKDRGHFQEKRLPELIQILS